MSRPNDVGVGTAICLLNEKGQMLMLRRKGSHEDGKLCWPGGWIDRADQTLLAAVQREALEEVGVTVKSALQVEAKTSDIPEYGFRTVTICFASPHTGWEVTPGLLEPDKCSEMLWVDLHGEDLDPDDLFPGLAEVIYRLRGFVQAVWWQDLYPWNQDRD